MTDRGLDRSTHAAPMSTSTPLLVSSTEMNCSSCCATISETCVKSAASVVRLCSIWTTSARRCSASFNAA
jgi:hypothetical protein